jgi:Low molecular weight phosphotyrosine protein phosphatase
MEQKFDDKIVVDSCGTGGWHVGDHPDTRMMACAKKYDVDLSKLRARQFDRQDFHNFDYIICMDESNYSDVMDLYPAGSASDSNNKKVRAKVSKFMDLVPNSSTFARESTCGAVLCFALCCVVLYCVVLCCIVVCCSVFTFHIAMTLSLSLSLSLSLCLSSPRNNS